LTDSFFLFATEYLSEYARRQMGKHALITLAFLIVFLATTAWLFRYEPVPGGDRDFNTVWDRWGHRFCLALNVPKISDAGGIACSAAEYSRLLTRVTDEQENKRRETEEAENQKKVQVAKVTEFVRQNLSEQKSGASQIEKLRSAGFSDEAIADWVREQRERYLRAGFSKNEVDEYFGGDPYIGAK
jgi:hypothetical protein